MEKMSNVVEIIVAFLGWVKSVLNALGITSFDERISNALVNLA